MKRRGGINDGLPTIFIVRIYRFPGNNGKKLAGVVETVGSEGKKGFNGFDELLAILTGGSKCKSQKS